jgi:glucose-1-phosphate cytidylyltransferase
MLTYGDGLADLNIDTLLEAHGKGNKICTISAVHPAGRFGSLAIDDEGVIHTFQEKPQLEKDYVNGGFMVCEQKIFDYLPDDPNLVLEREPFVNLTRDGQLHSYRHNGFWQPMDTYQEMLYLNRLWTQGRAPWKIW